MEGVVEVWVPELRGGVRSTGDDTGEKVHTDRTSRVLHPRHHWDTNEEGGGR